MASGVSRKPDDGRGVIRPVFASIERNCNPVRHLFRRLRRHLPLEGKDLEVIFVPLLRLSKDTAFRYDTSSVACGDTFPSRGRTWERNSSRFCIRRSGLRVKSLPLRGGWHPASPASRMTEEVIFVALLRPSERTARKIPPLEGRVASGVSRKLDDGRGDFRSASASVERNCDPIRHLFRRLRRHLPLEGKDLGAELVPLLRPSERAARKIPPLEGRVASGVSRKPDDGRGDLRSASASVETNCDPVRHLFRRLRRHLPLEGKDFVFRFVREKKPGRACFLAGFVLKYL